MNVKKRSDRRMSIENLQQRRLMAADVILHNVETIDDSRPAEISNFSQVPSREDPQIPVIVGTDLDDPINEFLVGRPEEVENFSLDVTGNGTPNPLQDGIIILRFMLGQPDENLADPNLIPDHATRTTGAELRAFLEAAGDALDVNGDGTINPFQDGILILRFLQGQSNEDLQDSSLIPEGSTRTTGAEIRPHLETLLPPAPRASFCRLRQVVSVKVNRSFRRPIRPTSMATD